MAINLTPAESQRASAGLPLTIVRLIDEPHKHIRFLGGVQGSNAAEWQCELCQRIIVSPKKPCCDCVLPRPGDVVACREEWGIAKIMPTPGGFAVDILYPSDESSNQIHITEEQMSALYRERGTACNSTDEIYFPASTMPDWAIRFKLPVTAARVCRVRDVTEEEAEWAGYVSCYAGAGDIIGFIGADAMLRAAFGDLDQWVSVTTLGVK